MTKRPLDYAMDLQIETAREASVLRDEIHRLRAEVEKLLPVYEAARGLCRGSDWNKGTHAKAYRKQLTIAVKAAQAGEGSDA